MEVAKLALTRNCPLIMNLSAPFICQYFVEPLMDAMPYVDVIFGNESVSLRAYLTIEKNLTYHTFPFVFIVKKFFIMNTEQIC